MFNGRLHYPLIELAEEEILEELEMMDLYEVLHSMDFSPNEEWMESA